MIWLDRFPLPPSVNKYLMPVAGKWVLNKKGKRYQQGRWIKTDVHRAYMDQCYLWRSSNAGSFYKIQEAILKYKKETEAKGGRFALKVECFFVFHLEQLITKDNTAQRLDCDNRLKPCLDALSKLLEIDDKCFFASSCEKVIASKESSECTIIRITPMIPRNVLEIRNQILQKPGS